MAGNNGFLVNDFLLMLENQKHNIGIPIEYSHHWEVLDNQGKYFLLKYYKTSSSPDWTGESIVAIISRLGKRVQLEHIETFSFRICFGILNASTSHAILVRYKECDDTVYERYGEDEVYIIDYQNNFSKSIAPFSYDIGPYHGGDIKIAINRKRNWLAVARMEVGGWHSKYILRGYLYDLADNNSICSGVLKDLELINSIELPANAEYLIVTDNSRRDHVFSISKGGFDRLNRIKDIEERWQVSISFSGKDRQIAERLANGLKENGVSVFYDEYEQADLWGKDLIQYLFDVYSQKSEYCIVIVSQNYLNGAWPMHELKAMQSKAFQSQREYILPITLDETKLPGLPPQLGYLDYRQKSIDSIIKMALKKLERTKSVKK